jgi:hypothetical protein
VNRARGFLDTSDIGCLIKEIRPLYPRILAEHDSTAPREDFKEALSIIILIKILACLLFLD